MLLITNLYLLILLLTKYLFLLLCRVLPKFQNRNVHQRLKRSLLCVNEHFVEGVFVYRQAVQSGNAEIVDFICVQNFVDLCWPSIPFLPTTP